MTTDGFEIMIDVANAFFAELRENNNKAWFEPRKAQYLAEIKKPADLFADLLAEDLSRISGIAHKPKQFRIYRDVRFSKDKSPLNTHLHILWMPPHDSAFRPAFFFGAEPGRLDVALGVIGFQGVDLARYRAFVDAWGDVLAEAIEETGMALSDWGPEPLKRVPKPYDPDHAQAEFLKRKALIIGRPLGEGWRGTEAGLIGAVRQAFEEAQPFAQLLRERFA